MKLRTSQVLGLAAVTVAAAFTVVLLTQKPTEKTASEDQFLQEIHSKLEMQPGAPETEVGALPPASDDQSIVPVIEVSTQALNMGLVPNDHKSTSEVVVRNTGRAVLKITEVKTSCGCTHGEMRGSGREIPPGGQGILDVTVEPQRIHGFDSTKRLTIYSNAANNGAINVDVTAKVDPEFILEPAETLDFGEVEKGATVEKTILFRQMSDPTALIADVSLSKKVEGVEVSYEQRPEDQWVTPGKPEYAITVRILPDVAVGNLRAPLQILTTCARVKKMTPVVQAQVKAFYSVTPQQMAIGSRRPGQGNVATLTVRSDDRPFELQNVQVTGQGLTATTRAGADAQSQLIDLAVTPDAVPGIRRENIAFTIKSDDMVYEEKVPFYGTILAPVQTPPGGAPAPAPAAPAPSLPVSPAQPVTPGTQGPADSGAGVVPAPTPVPKTTAAE